MHSLQTTKGTIKYPAFLPVTTFSDDFPLDPIVRPYLKRFAPAMMVSHYYAQKMISQTLPVFIDSGGFASFFKNSLTYQLKNGTYGILSHDGSQVNPEVVLATQEKFADIGATLDFIITEDTPLQDAKEKQDWIIHNAKWALANKKNPALKLFASLQAWDRDSILRILEALLPLPFDGFSLGGMVSRIQKPEKIFELVETFREEENDRPLHVFGIGAPPVVKNIFACGASSADSSSYIRHAVSKRYLDPLTGKYIALNDIENNLQDICKCTICQQFSINYLSLEGELNTMALAIHNLAATIDYLELGESHGL